MNGICRVLAVLTVAAAMAGIGAGVAMAASPEWLVEGVEVAKLKPAEAPKEGATGEFAIASTIAGVKFEVECDADITGRIKPGGQGEATFELTECAFGTPVTCSLAEPAFVAGATQLANLEGTMYDVLKPKVAGGRLATLEFKGAKCAIAGIVVVKGSTCAGIGPEKAEAVFQFPDYAVTALKDCAEAGVATGLHIGVEPAVIEAETEERLVALNLGEKWGAQ